MRKTVLCPSSNHCIYIQDIKITFQGGIVTSSTTNASKRHQSVLLPRDTPCRLTPPKRHNSNPKPTPLQHVYNLPLAPLEQHLLPAFVRYAIEVPPPSSKEAL